ncbi:MAG: hypothetical protein K6T73_07520 [Candidatus Bathyarchaeota archaeon]|nr:hypothetical protein [Candidatus Bathyarchaeota archaeon]
MRKTTCALVITLLAISLAMPFSIKKVNPLSATISIINPGPDGYPAKWNASTTVRDLGTSNFIFYSNETSVDSTFFLNMTVNDVEALKGWGTGLIYNNETLQYVSAWRPTDHVFKGSEEAGNMPIAPQVVNDEFNATHRILKWGYTYIMNVEWTFNGSGTLGQIQFKIIKEVNQTNPQVTAWFAFDPDWTSLYYHPTGSEIPETEPAYFEYNWSPLPTPTLKVEPPTYNAYRLNETFDINILIADLDEEWHLIAIQFALVYNTSIFEFVQWQNGTYLDGFVNEAEGESIIYFASSDYHGDPELPLCHNKIFVGVLFLPNSSGTYHAPFPSGSGVIGTITLKVIAEPPVSSLLTLNETELWNEFYTQIPHNVEHMTFSFLSIDETPPTIDDPTQNPPKENVQPDQPVTVSVNVTDLESGVKNVTLYYTNDTTWYNIEMTYNSTSGLWEATIPGYAADTFIQYKIEAYDNAENHAVNDKAGEYFTYTVIPEYAPLVMMILFMTASIIAVLVYSTKTKILKKTN